MQTYNVRVFKQSMRTTVYVDEKGETVQIYFVPHPLYEEPVTYSASMAFQVFRTIDQINLPYALICVDNTVVNLYDSTSHSKFICTLLRDDYKFRYDSLQRLIGCRILPDIASKYHRNRGYESIFCNMRNHLDNPEDQPVCRCVLCVRCPPSLRNLCIDIVEVMIVKCRLAQCPKHVNYRKNL
jgi:hypothetical protein